MADETIDVAEGSFAMADAMHYDTTWIDRVAVVSVRGVIDVLTAPRLTAELDDVLLRAPAGVVVDMSAVEFLASAGMTVLVATQHRMGPGRRLAVVADGPATSRPMKLIGIDSVVGLHQTFAPALLDVAPTTADADELYVDHRTEVSRATPLGTSRSYSPAVVSAIRSQE